MGDVWEVWKCSSYLGRYFLKKLYTVERSIKPWKLTVSAVDVLSKLF